ncbi:unnamed protein product [Urochloa decumbens]|uniref:DUF4283 domain-containing protein n=1 Tax=Urochloa decumbens TaxID=240449 RepID=A0ABC9E2I1_9POAL
MTPPCSARRPAAPAPAATATQLAGSAAPAPATNQGPPRFADLEPGGPSRELSPSEAVNGDAADSPKFREYCHAKGKAVEGGASSGQRANPFAATASFRDVVAGKASAFQQRQEVQARRDSSATVAGDSHGLSRSNDEDGFQAVKKPYWWRRKRWEAGERIEAGGVRQGGRLPVKLRLGPRIPTPPSELLLLLRAKARSEVRNTLFPHTAGREKQAQVQKEEQLKKMKFVDYVERPGEPHIRPDHVEACVARTQEVIDEERRLEIHALLGVQLDGRAAFSADQVRRDALRQLRIAEHNLQVKKIGQATFMLVFHDQSVRNMCLGVRSFVVGHTSIRLRPWKRIFGAESEKLRYKARLCLEGVPPHAWSCEAVAPLFKAPSFVERICEMRYEEKEKQCFCVWIWSNNLSGLAKSGTLRIAEPITMPEDYPVQMEDMDLPIARTGPADTLKYDVLIHLDRVEDFYPQPTGSSYRSYGRDISGMPNEEHVVQRPLKHRYLWHLGSKDGEAVERRTSALDRLGPRRRDRSPPGGGGDDRGLKQAPPPSYHGYWQMNAPSAGNAGGEYYGQGFQRGRRYCDGMEDGKKVVDDPSWLIGIPSRSHERAAGEQKTDAMMEEAALDSVPRSQEPEQKGVVTSADEIHKNKCLFPENDSSEPLVVMQQVVMQQEVSKEICENEMRRTWIDFLSDEAGMGNVTEKQRILMDGAVLQETMSKNIVEGIMDQELAMWPSEPVAHRDEEIGEHAGNKSQNDHADREEQTVKEVTLKVEKSVKKGQSARGMARMQIPLKKALLTNPVLRPRAAHMKKANADGAHSEVKAQRRTPRIVPKGASDLSLDDQATVLLMKTSGVISDEETVDAVAQEKFGTQFAEPLTENVVGDMRVTFGIQKEADLLGALAIDAEA